MKPDSNTKPLTIKRSVAICIRMLRAAQQIRPGMLFLYFTGAGMEIAASITSLYATARLAALVARFVVNGQTSGIWLWLWVDVAAAVVIGLGFLLMSFSRRLLYFAFTTWATDLYMKALCTIDLNDYYDESIRNQINKVGSAYAWQLSNLSGIIVELMYGIVRFLAITFVVAKITWWLVPVIILFLIPTFIGERKVAALQWFVWDKKGDERYIFWGLDYIVKLAKGQMEMRSSQASKYIRGKISHMNSIFYNEQEHNYRKASRILVVTKVLEAAGVATGSIVLLRQLLKRTISLDHYFFLSGALLRVGGALNSVFGTLSNMQDSLLLADSFFELTDREPKIIDKPNAKNLDTKAAPEIVIENLSFSYPGQDKPVFNNLSLTISPGEHVALVGENGAGKSTLIKLLLRFYRPDSGRILLNGTDLEDIAIESWYDHIATLFQDFNHYPFPIKENIEIGRPDKPKDAAMLKKAASFGSVDSMVSEYKHGWDTVLDSSFKKGIEPSGGQWQRVALARSFYRNASVLILDEPTSAIDAKAEYDIFNNIFEHYRDRTALIVSHRFSTVRRADRIIVLEHGKIMEQGSHESLMKAKGLYNELFSNQAEGYKE